MERQQVPRLPLEYRPTELRFPAMPRRLEFLVAALRAALAWTAPQDRARRTMANRDRNG